MLPVIVISVVVPVHNEEETLGDFVYQVVRALNQLDVSYEILLCENGSTDRTPMIAQGLSADYQQVRAESLGQSDYGKALKLGISRSAGKYIVLFNVDLWDIKFAEACLVDLDGYDILVGSKSMLGAQDKRALTRRLITRGFNILLRIIFGFQGTETHGIKAFSREKITKLLSQCRTEGEIFDTEILIRAGRMGFSILEVPVVVEEKRPSRSRLLPRVFRSARDLVVLAAGLRPRDCK